MAQNPCYNGVMADLRLKNLVLKSGVLQSPMAACSDLAFRLIAREKGMEFAFLEMVSAQALARKNDHTLDLMKTREDDAPVGAQLVGCDAQYMAESAAIVEEMGYDLLDLNLGCPVPKITGGGDGAGSALLRRPFDAGNIFRAVVGAVKKIPVTVKMRIGYEDETGDEAVEIAKRAEDAGVCAVAVHGRTRAQKYRGTANYEAIGRVKKAVSIPVIGNGDIRCAADALRMREISGCDAVMVARGALGNPWIYNNITNALNGTGEPEYIPTFEDRRETLLKHLEYEREFEGERRGNLQMRRVGCWYVDGIPGATDFRRVFTRLETLDEMKDFIKSFQPHKVDTQTYHSLMPA